MKFSIKIPKVRYCCFGINVRTGSILIGLFFVLCGALNCVWGFGVLRNKDEQSEIQNILAVCSGLTYLVCGLSILVGILIKQSVAVRIPCLIALANWLINLVMAFVLFTSYQVFFTWLSGIMAFFILCYFSIVLWSYSPLHEEQDRTVPTNDEEQEEN